MRLAILALLFFSAEVSAQTYVLGGVASTRNTAGDLNEKQTSVSLGIGYKIGNFAGEIACAAGKAGCNLSGVAAGPIAGGFSLIGKAGLHYLHGNMVQRGTPQGPDFQPADFNGTREARWSGWTAGVGVGAQYELGGGLAARLMLEQTGSVGPLHRSRSLSASLLYAF